MENIEYEEMILKLQKKAHSLANLEEETLDNEVEASKDNLSDEESKVTRTTLKSNNSTTKPNVRQIRDFPNELAIIVKNEFPAARKMSDALAAYVIVTSGKIPNDMSEEVKKLVHDYEGNHTLIDINERLDDLEKSQKQVNTILNELKVSTAWLLFDKFGFRRDHPSKISVSNIIEDGVEELMEVMEKQSREMRQIRSRKRYRGR